MIHRRLGTALCLTLLALGTRPESAPAAAPDGNVEWQGLSHVAFQDRRPLCPRNGESFTVRFQAYRDDLTAARVQVSDGSTTWVTASVVDTRGPYDLWDATVPATASATLSYWMELTDGADVDYLSRTGVTDGAPADGGFALDFTTLEHAPIGATLVSGGAVFKVWAPTRTTAHVRGDFNGWGTTSLTKVGEHFIGFAANVTNRQQYKYYFNNSVWNSDPRARALNPSNNYNSFVEDPFRYAWSVDGFTTPPLEEMVIYQLHIGTFSGRNDPLGNPPHPGRYVDVAARASQLKALGVNAVMLNPPTEFPGDLSAGYNPVTAWAPEYKYGTPDAFKVMVDSLHANGIAVLVDIVWNHFSPTDNYLWNYDGTQIYFDSPVVETPWGSQADFDRTAVADYYADSALHWLEESRVDGFRMDATDYMNISPQEAAGWALMQRLNDAIDDRWADKVAIAEQLPDDSWVTRPTSLGGAGFDAQYYDLFTDDLRQEILDAASGDPEMWKIRNIVLGGGQFLSGRYVVNYLELHDEAWPSSGGQRLVKTIDPVAPHDADFAQERIKAAQGLVLTAPGTPAFLMGSEWLEDTDFGVDLGNRIDWSKRTTYGGIYRYFQDLIALRIMTPAFRSDAQVSILRTDDSANVLAFRRMDFSGNTFVVILNLANVDRLDYRLGMPDAAPWRERVNSDDVLYDGGGLVNAGTLTPEAVFADGYPQSLALDLPARSLLVLSDDAGSIGLPDDGGAAPGGLLRAVHPNPTRAGATIEFGLEREAPVRITVYDLRGRTVARVLEGVRPAGVHRTAWDGREEGGRPAGAGVYFIAVETPGRTETRKLVRLR